MYLLITYDISNDKRRNKIDKLLSSYGTRVNYSVFELEIKAHIYSDLEFKLSKLMHKDDSVRLYRFTKTTIQDSVELGEHRSNPFEKEVSYV
jgi:CRISPR-associated protein Cas2